MAHCRELLQEHWPEIRFSSLFISAPRVYEEQDSFLNAVAAMKTSSPPEEVLHVLQSIEKEIGKNPPFRYGPRTIDLDLLLYGNTVIPGKEEWMYNNEISTGRRTLTIPHPCMHKRRFVLEPLCELIETEAMHPVLERAWSSLLHDVLDQDCIRRETQETSGRMRGG